MSQVVTSSRIDNFNRTLCFVHHCITALYWPTAGSQSYSQQGPHYSNAAVIVVIVVVVIVVVVVVLVASSDLSPAGVPLFPPPPCEAGYWRGQQGHCSVQRGHLLPAP